MWNSFKTGLSGGAGASIGWAIGQWFVKWMRRLLLSLGALLSAAGLFGSPFESAKPAAAVQKPSVVKKAAVTQPATPAFRKEH